jgi:uncharacterized membrane protein YebE (DUF533 family)
MSTRQLLDQLLRSGQDLAKQWAGGQQGNTGTSGLQDKLGSLLGGNQTGQSQSGGNGLSSLLTGFGGGAISGGALALLLSNKKARKIGGNLAVYGGMAALGALAFKAYGDWQRNHQQTGNTPAPAPQTLDRLPPAQAEQHSSAVLIAMIGAAKADGHIGAEETQLLEQEMARLSNDANDQRWLHEQLSQPLDPAVVARASTTPEMAVEMYLASLLVVDEETFMERAYLDQLAKELKLDPALKKQLEQQVNDLAGTQA